MNWPRKTKAIVSLIGVKFILTTMFYNSENNEQIIHQFLKNSELANSGYLLVETSSNVPIIRIAADYFIEHWLDYINASSGMGSIVLSENFKLLLEFTDDAKWRLFSNFKIFDSGDFSVP